MNLCMVKAERAETTAPPLPELIRDKLQNSAFSRYPLLQGRLRAKLKGLKAVSTL